MSPRNVGARALLDPRWHWLKAALDRLYAELDNGAQLGALSLITDDGVEMVSYSVSPGEPQIMRRVLTDMETVIAGVLEGSADATADTTPEALA